MKKFWTILLCTVFCTFMVAPLLRAAEEDAVLHTQFSSLGFALDITGEKILAVDTLAISPGVDVNYFGMRSDWPVGFYLNASFLFPVYEKIQGNVYKGTDFDFAVGIGLTLGVGFQKTLSIKDSKEKTFFLGGLGIHVPFWFFAGDPRTTMSWALGIGGTASYNIQFSRSWYVSMGAFMAIDFFAQFGRSLSKFEPVDYFSFDVRPFVAIGRRIAK
jgi:hypothetical protein